MLGLIKNNNDTDKSLNAFAIGLESYFVFGLSLASKLIY